MDTKAIVNARLIDGTGREPVERGTIVIDGGAIKSVGPAHDVAVPDDATRIDAAGRTAMPGLIDGHMHVTSMPGLLDAKGLLAQSLKAVGKLRQCLRWGTTTVVNVSGCPEMVLLRDMIDDGTIAGCARMPVAAMVNATGGHVRGRDADGPWEVRKAVREMCMANVDLIKTAASGGFMWEYEAVTWEDYTTEELAAVVDEAHRKDKRVAVHAHSQPGLDHAIETGCDIITHGALIDDKALEGIAAKGLHFMPTLYITSDHVVKRPKLAAHMKERMSHAQPIHREGVRRAHEMGIAISAGTDGGPGSLMLELIELANCGLSPMDTLVVATRNTADALGMLDQVGTLEPGKRADLILIDGDPLDDIAIMSKQENVLLVMKRGKVEATADGWKEHLDLR